MPAKNDMTSEPPVPCSACGKEHGSVNAEWNCMRDEIQRLRLAETELTKQNAQLLEELGPIRKLRAEIKASPPSHVNLRGR